MNIKFKIILISLISLILGVASAAFANPKITAVELGQAVANGYYVVAFDTSDPYGMASSSTLKGIWINPGETSGDVNTSVSSPVAVVAPAEMFNAGDKSVYPAILVSLPTNTISMGMELLALLQNQNPVISQNADVSQIPTNVKNIDLSRAIPAGTSVKFTVDMDGEPLHTLAVMGGTEPVVIYDAAANEGKGEATIQTTTFATRNAAGQELNSIVGFILVTNQQGGTDPLRIIMQTDSWGGDIVPPSMFTDGTMGTIETMCGISAYGPAGESRDFNMFFPDNAINTVFGSSSGVTPNDLGIFIDSEQLVDSNTTLGLEKLGVMGTELNATYTFTAVSRRASGDDVPRKNVAVGVRSEPVCLCDVDGDGKIGLAEAIKILQILTSAETSGQER